MNRTTSRTSLVSTVDPIAHSPSPCTPPPVSSGSSIPNWRRAERPMMDGGSAALAVIGVF